MRGSIALVGSGEFLPIMADFEKSLINDGIKNGKAAKYVQIPTAAGQGNCHQLAERSITCWLQRWRHGNLRRNSKLQIYKTQRNTGPEPAS